VNGDPVTTEGTFAGVGGVPIHWERSAPPAGAPRGVVLLAHGYAEHVGRYRDFIAHSTARGLAVAAIDHRGHGRSGGPRGHCRDFVEFIADLHTLAGMAEEWWPGVPCLLLGHSMGGLLAFLYLLRHPDMVRAGALSAPAFEVADSAPRILQAVALLLARVAPRVTFRSNLDPGALSRDPAVGAAYVADPLVHRAASAGFVRAIRAAQAAAMAEAPRLRVPLLILQGDADRLVRPSGATEIAARLSCPHELVLLPGFYHELLNEPASERGRVLEALDRWFDRWLVV
jgi:alpha-beta hydrolase superfamily lysophospholipase